ncbi:MAG: S-layer homology domain-containing protein [Clostridia bacterium]|nr:S-layer homology domain-containing protein [Clostridia bacterium]
MKKIISKILILSLICITALSGMCAMAESELSVNVGYDPQSRMLTVYGQSDEFVIVTVVEKSVDYSSLYESEPAEFQYLVPDNGQYSFEFDFSDAAQSSKYIVSATTYTQSASAEFICYSYESAQEIFENELKGKTETEFAEAFKSNSLSFGIELNEDTPPEKEAEILRLLYACGSDNGAKVSSDYKKACLYAELGLMSEENIEEFLYQNAELFGIDYQTQWADEISGVDATEALSYISDFDFADLLSDKNSDFGGFLDTMFLSLKATNVHSWLELKNIITVDYVNIFEELLSSDDYNSIDDKDDVFIEMLKYKSEFTTAQKISARLESCILTVKEYEDERASQKSPSHSSGGGGGGGGKITPVVIDGGYTSPNQEQIIEQPTDSKTDVQTVKFNDVTKSHWCYEDITALCAKGIINGYDGSVFNPDKTVTRAEFVKMMILAMDYEVPKEYSGSFSDVDASDWFAPYIDAAHSSGAVSGDGHFFYPDIAIKREDAAVIVSRMAKNMFSDSQTQNSFSDKEHISDYATDAVTLLSSNGIINGFEDGSFQPKKEITRAESARIICKIMELIK